MIRIGTLRLDVHLTILPYVKDLKDVAWNQCDQMTRWFVQYLAI